MKRLNNRNDLLVEVVLFSGFSIKFAQIAHALFFKPSIYVVLGHLNNVSTFIFSANEFHVSGPNDERLFFISFCVYVFNLKS